MRCPWADEAEPIYVAYHDNEWGKPTYDDQQLFEMLCLEGAQAGLSWITILKKRETYREVFDQFVAEKIIQYDQQKINQLMKNPGIIRNRLKINAFICNAQAYLTIRQKYGTFSSYIWSFVDGKPLINHWETMEDVPTQTERSNDMSKQLKKDGFKFVGPTICYAFMQATGMVNDHLTSCKYK